ncbi:hypothetical protein XU18_3338 [Perkinsela sp. CCAP 1560/4]|nr:hypothetical protein XU18_3338 [Perkinsela sp. CCAP 1560/4]|eukprot:KNH05670.1 hypothetical protein XU18_3338 [Perkinsela sp. CCAP 1560/4]
MTDQPVIEPGLLYVLIPAQNDVPLKTCTFNGQSDALLKREIEKYFQSFGITEGQKQDFQEKVMQQGMQKIAQSASEDKNKSQAPTAETVGVFQNYINDRITQFEIVPVIMPSLNNGYVGRSFYIDEVGRYKELPLNERASKIAQRDIRGDCFMLSNRDDPSADKWERVHTTVADVDAMLKSPPKHQPDPTSTAGQASAFEAAKKQKVESVILSPEIINEVAEKKAGANTFFTSGAYSDAVTHYSELLNMLLGREESLSNADRHRLSALRGTLLTNRALCYFKLNDFVKSQEDSHAAIADTSLPKPYVIWIKSCLMLKDFAACQRAIDQAILHFPENDTIVGLQKSLNDRIREEAEREKALCRNMFAQ